MLFLGANHKGEKQYLDLAYANRHGLVAGATGTGKTVSLQVLAEGFSAAGVPVFLADIKGDLSGIAAPSAMQGFVTKRATQIGYDDFEAQAAPVIFWDVFGRKGTPIRATISEMGPVLLARMLELNDTQEAVLTVAFKVADAEGLLLLDLKDLQSLLVDISGRAKALSAQYGQMSGASIASIQRRLLQLEEQGGTTMFGEPALDLTDLMRKSGDKGVVSVLDATDLIHAPRLYATFLLWMLTQFYEQLPEAGDLDKPKLVFFFDEAHLLFKDAPKALVDRIEQVVRLIRSKAVGVYFVTQSPTDVPENVLGQLGCRVQHALRAFTPQAQKAIKVAAQTFRQNPDINTEAALTELGVGEALVSTLQEGGVPSMVERVLMAPPESQVGVLDEATRQNIIKNSAVAGVYDTAVDRESAYEMLKARANAPKPADAGMGTQPKKRSAGAGRPRQSVLETAVKSLVRSLSGEAGRKLVRVAIDSLTKGKAK